MHGCRFDEISLVENPSDAVICRRKLRDGLQYELLFVIFFRFRNFGGVLANEVREFDFFSGGVFQCDVKLV